MKSFLHQPAAKGSTFPKNPQFRLPDSYKSPSVKLEQRAHAVQPYHASPSQVSASTKIPGNEEQTCKGGELAATSRLQASPMGDRASVSPFLLKMVTV